MRRLRLSPRDFGVPLSNTFTISFGDVKPKNEMLHIDDSLGYEVVGATKIPIISRNPIQAQDHRKRREKLNQNFISLSSLIPTLNKMDKASVLEDAPIYIKELQDRVKELEGLSNKEKECSRLCITCVGFISLDRMLNQQQQGCWRVMEVEQSNHSLNFHKPSKEQSIGFVTALQGFSVMPLHIYKCCDQHILKGQLEQWESFHICGPVKSGKHVPDPTTGAFKGFGVLHALRLLSKLSIDGQELMLNFDNANKEYLKSYVEKKKENLKNTEGSFLFDLNTFSIIYKGKMVIHFLKYVVLGK
uniref:BHLH domain-containing protein n=1 Tax=Lactuca sativa TaxID=4236 RepID=A0A9R1XFS9_LACSA|nr:hypothetical protein LSAT_V11C500244540 [Lactuca sativa]